MDRGELRPRVHDVAAEIASMETRGAAAIADEAAVALRTQAVESDAETAPELLAELRAVARLLLETRPTAVSQRPTPTTSTDSRRQAFPTTRFVLLR